MIVVVWYGMGGGGWWLGGYNQATNLSNPNPDNLSRVLFLEHPPIIMRPGSNQHSAVSLDYM